MDRGRRLRLNDNRKCWDYRKLLNVTGAAEPALSPRPHVPRNSSQGVRLATRRTMSMSGMAMLKEQLVSAAGRKVSTWRGFNTYCTSVEVNANGCQPHRLPKCVEAD